ncbi:phosphomevalonate kinase [Mortierella sp. AD094]|nr:phosphomevalonate kinase [Mortierella sp. AD094]
MISSLPPSQRHIYWLSRYTELQKDFEVLTNEYAQARNNDNNDLILSLEENIFVIVGLKEEAHKHLVSPVVSQQPPVVVDDPRPALPPAPKSSNLESDSGVTAQADSIDEYFNKLQDWHRRTSTPMTPYNIEVIWTGMLPSSHRFLLFLGSVKRSLDTGDHAAIMRAFRDRCCSPYEDKHSAYNLIVWKSTQTFAEFVAEFKHVAIELGLSFRVSFSFMMLGKDFVRRVPASWNLERFLEGIPNSSTFDDMVSCGEQQALAAGIVAGPGCLCQPDEKIRRLFHSDNNLPPESLEYKLHSGPDLIVVGSAFCTYDPAYWSSRFTELQNDLQILAAEYTQARNDKNYDLIHSIQENTLVITRLRAEAYNQLQLLLISHPSPAMVNYPKPALPPTPRDSDLESASGATAQADSIDEYFNKLQDWHRRTSTPMTPYDIDVIWSSMLPLSHRFLLFLVSVRRSLDAGDHATVMKTFRERCCCSHIAKIHAYWRMVWKPTQTFLEFVAEFKHVAMEYGLSFRLLPGAKLMAYNFIRCVPHSWHLDRFFAVGNPDADTFDDMVAHGEQQAVAAGITAGPGRLCQPDRELAKMKFPNFGFEQLCDNTMLDLHSGPDLCVVGSTFCKCVACAATSNIEPPPRPPLPELCPKNILFEPLTFHTCNPHLTSLHLPSPIRFFITMSPSNTTIVSAPGKVLIAGGYLVLDPTFSGLVVATDARFYTLIRPSSNQSQSSSGKFKITVRSPQFDNATWNYWVTIQESSKDVKVSASEEDPSRNTFVELALVYSFGILGHLIPVETIVQKLETGLDIVIAGNNDFYSQRNELEKSGLQLNTESLRKIPLFAPTHTTLSKVSKTGLGSSAALITSLVSAIFIHFGASSLQQQQQDSNNSNSVANSTKLLHNAAQFVHCLAQGKVGSGFDVSSAVWGSHTYRRFSPEVLESVMHQDAKDDIPALIKVLDPKQTTWDNVVVPFKLAPRLHIMLADIDAGSHTPTLVSNVLKWRKNKPEEANALWSRLGAANDKVVELLKRLDQLSKGSESSAKEYYDAIQRASAIPASEWPSLKEMNATTELLILIYEEFSTVRNYLREMSRLSSVPVEPEEQTRLLDACLAVPGVLMAGVPGAGGFDAIFCIVLSDESRKSVESVWSNFKEMSVGPLLCKESLDGGLVVELGQGQSHDAQEQPSDEIRAMLAF